MAYDTARDALAKLVDAGMPGKDGTVYSVPADVVEIADRLAVLVGREHPLEHVPAWNGPAAQAVLVLTWAADRARFSTLLS